MKILYNEGKRVFIEHPPKEAAEVAAILKQGMPPQDYKACGLPHNFVRARDVLVAAEASVHQVVRVVVELVEHQLGEQGMG